jgi:phosphoribosylformylglycinamidine cyclo-ligase
MIHDSSDTSWDEMYEVFNMGHRFEIYIQAGRAQEIIGMAHNLGIDARIVGRVEACNGKKLTIASEFGTFVY